MKIKVRYPEEKIITKNEFVSINRIFLQNEFFISIIKDNSSVTFEVNLPEWLLKLSSFLKDRETQEINEVLPLSGSHFNVRKNTDEYKVSIFNLETGLRQWMIFSEIEMNLFHAKLVCELLEAVKHAAGRPMKIVGLEALKV